MSDFPEMDYKQIEMEQLIELAPHETSLDFFRKIYHSVRQPITRRMRAAEFAVLARLVSTVPIRKLYRSNTVLRLDQLCQLIGDDLRREGRDQSRTQPA